MHAPKRHISHIFRCGICKEDFTTKDSIKMHYIHHHLTPENSMFREIETAFNRRIMTFSCNFPDMGITSVDMIGEHIHHHSTELIKHQLRLQHLVRFLIIMIVEFVKYEEMGKIDDNSVSIFHLRSTSRSVLLSDLNNISSKVNQCLSEIENRNEQFLANGSGWVLNQIKQANIEIGKITLAGGCNETRLSIPNHKKSTLLMLTP